MAPLQGLGPCWRASVELWVAGLRNAAALHAALRPAGHELDARSKLVVDGPFGVTFSGPPGYPALRGMLLPSMRVVTLTYAFEPRTAR